MAFNGQKTNTQINQSAGAALLLNSSCQGIIEASINPVSSNWYDTLNNQLAQAENLVINWRRSGYLYFQQSILTASVSCGEQFINEQSNIDALYGQLSNDFSKDLLNQIIDKINALASPLQNLTTALDGYLDKVADFQNKMQVVYSEMHKTVLQIQNEAAHIQSEIDAINSQIANMQQQIVTDRQAIAKAESAKKKGIAETIFGVVLAPFTLGASLILAGIGVASIVEAEDKVKSLESSIKKYQSQITGLQGNLSDDDKEIATLKGLSMSVEMACKDMEFITQIVGPLRTTYSGLTQEIEDISASIASATTSKDAFVGKFWFDDACNEWSVIVNNSKDLNQQTISTTHKMINS